MVDWAGFERALAARRRAIVEGFAEWLRVHTVSQEPERVRRGAAWLARAMEARGLAPHILETGGNPCVFGERRVAGARGTVLVYCHFDVPYANAGNRQHSPNEHLRLDHLFQGVRTTAQLLVDLGR